MIPVVPPPPPPITGQWTGYLNGETPALGVLELEQIGAEVFATAFMYPQDPGIVPALVRFQFAPPLSTHRLQNLRVFPFSPDLGAVITRQQMAVDYPNSDVSDTANVTLTFTGNTVLVFFDTALVKGFGTLTKGHTLPSGLTSIPMSWDQFKADSTRWEQGRFVYRGQSAPWRLRTSFHRTWRKNLDTYTSQLIRDLQKALTPKLKTPLDFTKPEDVGAFYSMAQHHGYPTPLLDWTRSPFVAAFFAFEHQVATNTTVRIIAFDKAAWTRMGQERTLTHARPHLSFVDLLPYDNDRAVPQQSEFTLTNIDDIENHVVMLEYTRGTQFLYAIDIPASERTRVLSDLSLMGIDHASMFPGKEGICKAMRYKHFGC